MAKPSQTTEQDEQRNLEELTRKARLEMQTNPEAVRQRLLARGATEEQVSGLFANLGFALPSQPQPGQTVLPVQHIQPASVQYGAGATTLPSGRVAFPETPIVASVPGSQPGQTVLPVQHIQPASVQYGAGATTLPSGQVAFPETPIVAGTPAMTDEDILRGGMYVQPQQGVVAGKQ